MEGETWLGQPINGGPHRCLILGADTGGLEEYAERLGPGYDDAVQVAIPPSVNADAWEALAAAALAECITVVVIDNLYAWAGALDMNANAEVAGALACLRALAAAGIAVVLVHHTNSGGQKPAGVHAIQAFFRHSLKVTLDRVRAHGNDAARMTYPLRRQGGRVLGLGLGLGLGQSLTRETAEEDPATVGARPVKAARAGAADRYARAVAALEKRPDLTSIRGRGTHLYEVMDDVGTRDAGREIVKTLIDKGLLPK